MLSIECQLAQAQMSRYLAGDVLPPDSLEELRRHIDKCTECQTFAEEERIELEKMLASGMVESAIPRPGPDSEPEDEPALVDQASEPPPQKAARKSKETRRAPEPQPEDEPEDLLAEPVAAFADAELDAALMSLVPEAPDPAPAEAADGEIGDPIAAIQDKVPQVERRSKTEHPRLNRRIALPALPKLDLAKIKDGARKNVRTLALSVALAVVLVVMSAFAANPGKLFGAKAAERPVNAEQKSGTKAAGTPDPAPEIKEAEPAGEEAEPPQPEPEHVAKPEPKPEPVAAPRPEPQPAAAARPKPRPKSQAPRSYVSVAKPSTPKAQEASRRPDVGTIEVFDAQGRPIDPTQGN